MKLHLVMPMGGGGTRFENQGYSLPKPLIPIYDKPFFYWATKSIEKFVDIESLTFVVLKFHVDNFHIDDEIVKYFPYARIKILQEVLPGAVLTCKVGVDDIPENEAILFNDCDHLFICNEFYDFCNNGNQVIDGALLTFASNEDKFSYVAYGEDGFVNRTIEKEVISNDAICGAYYFKDRKTFLDATYKYLEECDYKEFYVSGLYNVMAEQSKKIITMHTDKHVSFGTPEEFVQAQNDTTYLKLQ